MSEGGLTAGVSIRRLELETPDTGFWEVMNLSGRVTCISSMCHTGIPTSGFATFRQSKREHDIQLCVCQVLRFRIKVFRIVFSGLKWLSGLSRYFPSFKIVFYYL